MRFALLCGFAFVADTAFASVCKPRSPSGSSTISATASVHLSTSIANTASRDKVTTEASDPQPTSAEVSIPTIETTVSTDLSSAITTEPTISISSSYVETTTAAIFTTTTAATVEPIPTFNLVAKGASVNGQYLTGQDIPGALTGWQMTVANSVTKFSIDRATSYVSGPNGWTWCVSYGTDGDPNFVELCNENLLNGSDPRERLSCIQTRNHEIQCSVSAKSCTLDMDTFEASCSALTGTFSAFYAFSGRADGIWLVMGSADIPPAGSNYQSVKLGVMAAK